MNESANFVKCFRKLRLVLKANFLVKPPSEVTVGLLALAILAKASKATVTVPDCSRKTDSLDTH